MKAFTRAALVALSLLAMGSAARAGCPPVKFDAGVNAHLNGYFGKAALGAQAGPWYSYFPYNAYFQTPAPVGGWPFWPTTSATAGMPYSGAPAGPAAGPPQSMFYAPRGIQPVGYGAPAPSYWYGR
jgi:hypothetical protein